MLFKQLQKDWQRSRAVTAALFIFVMLAALLVASATNMIIQLVSSLGDLFVQAKVPHFVQMHLGELDQAEIDAFAAGNELVSEQQTVEMIGVPGSALFLGGDATSQEHSVMDVSLVKQNESFDLLLNLANQEIQVDRGEIAVPVYYLQQKQMQLGDRVRINDGKFSMQFRVSDFVRDAQMNPSIVTSKRFVVSDADFEKVRGNFGQTEYLIEFLLADSSRVSEFGNAYQAANLPEGGPTVNHNLLKMMNALTDGMVAVVALVVSLLLVAIALLCLGFTIIAGLEDDYKQIGIMKAIGISDRDIRQLYLSKYTVMAGLASVSGYLASLLVNRVLTANITLYMGAAERSALLKLVPAVATATLTLAIVAFCRLILGRFRRISAVQALRSGLLGGSRTRQKLLSPGSGDWLGINLALGLQDVLARAKSFAVLGCIFVICSFITIVPLNLLTTIQSPDFATYMGVGQSDLRIDVQQFDQVEQRLSQLLEQLAADPDVEKLAALVTSRFRVLNSAGRFETINVETGDFAAFPLEYLAGSVPVNQNEIALSYLSAQELGKQVGDALPVLAAGLEHQLTVVGIYQDVTNGGRTAKALLPVDADDILWSVINLSLHPGVDLSTKAAEYSAVFNPAKVTQLKDYVWQTFGATIRQLRVITALAIAIAQASAALITALFLRMLIAKDSRDVAILKSIGFSLLDIRLQYMARALAVLCVGVVAGTLASNTLGQAMVSLLGSFMGASRISFVINPVFAYILCPLALALVVAATTLVSTAQMQRSSISQMVSE